MAEILVVDDKIGIRELLSEILGDEGHSITLAENAQDAREARLAYAPNLVLLDVWMPDTDGVTLLKEWAHQGLLTMPVIMMSGHATIDIAVEATRIGARSFLEKPITLQNLLKAVQQALAGIRELSYVPKVIRTKQGPQSPRLPLSPVAAASGDRIAPVASFRGRASSSQASSNGERVNIVSNGELLSYTLSFELPLGEARNTFERMYFEHLLDREEGSMTRVSAKAGLERAHLYRKLKQLGAESSKLGRRKTSKGYP